MSHFNENRSNIPEIFWSHASREKFRKCTICDTNLLQSKLPYVIEKAIKQYSGFDKHDVIFEYALCLNCIEELRGSMSVQSSIRMQKFFEENIQTKGRFNRNETSVETVEHWLDKCIITGKSRKELEEYQIIGLFRGNQMILAETPYMISSEVGDQINELLSKQTKDEMDGFKDRFLGPPPELEELFKHKRVILY